MFFSHLLILSKINFFKKILSGIPNTIKECQTVWNEIRPNILSLVQCYTHSGDWSQTSMLHGVLTTFSATYFTEGRTSLPIEAIGPEGSNCFSRGSVPVFLKKPIPTCDFQGSKTPNPPSGSTHDVLAHVLLLFLVKENVRCFRCAPAKNTRDNINLICKYLKYG